MSVPLIARFFLLFAQGALHCHSIWDSANCVVGPAPALIFKKTAVKHQGSSKVVKGKVGLHSSHDW